MPPKRCCLKNWRNSSVSWDSESKPGNNELSPQFTNEINSDIDQFTGANVHRFWKPQDTSTPPLKLTAVHMKIMGKRPKIGENLGTKGLRVWGGNERLDTPNFMANHVPPPRNSQSPLWSVWKPHLVSLKAVFWSLISGQVCWGGRLTSDKCPKETSRNLSCSCSWSWGAWWYLQDFFSDVKTSQVEFQTIWDLFVVQK